MKLLELFDTHLPAINTVSTLLEAPKVGREYQHLEDLLITDGAKGGIDAINELKHIAQQPDTMNMKWDGGAAVYWGRNGNGEFVFAPKNQWDKGQILDRTGLATEVQHTGRPRPGQSPEEFAEIRKGMAQRYIELWDLFERATPKNFRGYLNGDLMFTEPQRPGPDGYYEFTPNKVTYRVAPNGLYGKMKTAKAFVAVHGKLNEFGAEATGNIEQISEAEVLRFNKTPALIVLPTQHPNVKLNPIEQEAETALVLIKNNAIAIDTISNYTADRFTGFKKVLYDYAVKRAKSNGNLDFIAWLTDSKLSAPQKAMTQKVITEKSREWEIFWTAFDAILKLKHDVLEDLHKVHGKYMSDNLGITAITNNKPGGEGFVKSMKNGGMAKLVNPNFRSAPDNPRFKPDLNESYADVSLTRLVMLLYDYNIPESGPFGPDLVKGLNYFKSDIVRELLKIISFTYNRVDPNSIRIINKDIVEILDRFKENGINWPELDAISRSVNSTNLKENAFNNWVPFELTKGMNAVDRSYIDPVAEVLERTARVDSITHELAHLGNVVNRRKLTFPDISKRLERYKSIILKDLFNEIKENGVNWSTRDATIALRSLGVNWPELTAIEKSVNATHIIDEAALMQSPESLIKLLPRMLIEPNPHGLWHWLDKISSYSTLETRRIIFSTPEVQTAILTWVGKKLNTKSKYVQYQVINTLKRLSGFSTDPWTNDNSAIINKIKKPVIKSILALYLHDMNTKWFDDTKDTLRYLRHMGIDYPEFNIIEKSISTISIKEDLDDFYNNASDDAYLNRRITMILIMLNNYTDEDLWSEIYLLGEKFKNHEKFPNKSKELNRHKKGLLTYILKYISECSKKDYNEVLMWISTLKKLGATWPEFNVIEKSLDSSEQLSEASNVHLRMITDLLDRYKLPYLAAFRDPEQAKRLDANKRDIIKDLLEIIHSLISDDDYTDSFKYINNIIISLRTLGIKWPELAAIEKSVGHEMKKNITEDNDEPTMEEDIEDNVQGIIAALNANDYSKDSMFYDCLFHFGDYYEDIDIKFPDISKLLNQHKAEVLTSFLSNIKSLNFSTFFVPKIILGLRKLGCKWPELDIISKSIAFDKDREVSTLDEADREKIKCWSCDGTGVEYGETCLSCGGKGEVWDDNSYIEYEDEINDSDYHNYIWNDKTELDEEIDSRANKHKGVVWSFGRMNPGHWGHYGLMMTLAKEAVKRGYDWKLFVSSKQEPEKNPLTYDQKVKWLFKLYPELNGHLVVNPGIKTPLVAATWLYSQGYRESVFVAGEDDMPAYSAMINNGNNHGQSHPEMLEQGKAFFFDPSEFVISPRLTSATSVRKTVADNDPIAFAKAILGPRYNEVSNETVHDIETNMFNDVKNGMIVPAKLLKKSKLIKEDEYDDSSNDDIINNIAQAIQYKSNFDLYWVAKRVFALYDDGIFKASPKLFDNIRNLLNDSKTEILGNLNLRLGKGFYLDICIILYYLKETGLNYTWISTWVTNNKAIIIKQLLVDLKDNNLSLPTESIRLLKIVGVDWPELDIIKKSIDVDKTKMISEDPDHTLSDDDIYDKILHYLNNQNIYTFCTYLQYLKKEGIFKNSPKLFNDVNELLNDNRERLITSMDSIIRVNNYEYACMSAGILSKIGFRYNWMSEWLQDNKTKIITQLLTDIKNDMMLAPKRAIKSLKFTKVDWPELRMIEKSLNASKQENLTEDIIKFGAYGGWIDSKTRTVYYTDDENPTDNRHVLLALKLGARKGSEYHWMFNNGYVRFVCHASSHPSSMSIEGKMADIKAAFKAWYPAAAKLDKLFVDESDSLNGYLYDMRNNPKEELLKMRNQLGPAAIDR